MFLVWSESLYQEGLGFVAFQVMAEKDIEFQSFYL